MKKSKEIIIDAKDFEMSQKQLQDMQQILIKEAKYFCKKHYGLNFNLPLNISKRLTRTYGYFQCRSRQKVAIKIDISYKMIATALAFGDFDMVLDVLRHELVHYSLFMLDRDYYDGDEDFESELARLNISASGVTAKNRVKSTRTLKVYEAYPRFQCKCCGEIINVMTTVNRTKDALIFCKSCNEAKQHERVSQIAVQAWV